MINILLSCIYSNNLLKGYEILLLLTYYVVTFAF